MVGLIKEGEGLIKSDIEPCVLDAGLIAASQRIEHYEMAGYGTVRTFAIPLPRSFIASSDLEKHGYDRLEATITSGWR